MHGTMIQKYVQSTRIMSEPAIHVPRTIFWATLALFYLSSSALMKNLGKPHSYQRLLATETRF